MFRRNKTRIRGPGSHAPPHRWDWTNAVSERSPSRGRSVLCALRVSPPSRAALITFPSWDGRDRLNSPVIHTRPRRGGRGRRCVALFFFFFLLPSDLLCCRALCIACTAARMCEPRRPRQQGTAAGQASKSPALTRGGAAADLQTARLGVKEMGGLGRGWSVGQSAGRRVHRDQPRA